MCWCRRKKMYFRLAYRPLACLLPDVECELRFNRFKLSEEPFTGLVWKRKNNKLEWFGDFLPFITMITTLASCFEPKVYARRHRLICYTNVMNLILSFDDVKLRTLYGCWVMETAPQSVVKRDVILGLRAKL